MNLSRIVFILACVCTGLPQIHFYPAAAQMLRSSELEETTNQAGIKLSYLKDAKLADAELKQVLSLARQAEITNVGLVSTFYYIPGGGKGIIVEGKETRNGRNISFDRIWIYKIGWFQGQPALGSHRAGEFWINLSEKSAVLQRTYDFGGVTRRIIMGKQADIPIADKVIPLIAVRKVRFKNHFMDQFNSLDVLKPDMFNENRAHGGYELWFDPNTILRFRYENGEVIITSIDHYAI